MQENVIITDDEILFETERAMTAENTQNIIGIDVGGSTTKIVGLRVMPNGAKEIISPLFVRATDPITSIYGAFGKFTSENGLSLDDIDGVKITGVGSSFMSKPIYSLDCTPVTEFTAVGLGGLYLSGLSEAIVVSMGTGTAIIHAKKTEGGTDINYLGGTGVGGGTLVGLTKKLVGVDTIEHIEQICEGGDLSNVDLRVGDISKSVNYKDVKENITASNFGKLSDMASASDIALGVANMVAETVFMMSSFAARGYGLNDIVLIGSLTNISPVRNVFENLGPEFGMNFIIPENASFGTAIGAALSGKE